MLTFTHTGPQVHTSWCGYGRHRWSWCLCRSVQPRDQAQTSYQNFTKALTQLEYSMERVGMFIDTDWLVTSPALFPPDQEQGEDPPFLSRQIHCNTASPQEPIFGVTKAPTFRANPFQFELVNSRSTTQINNQRDRFSTHSYEFQSL